MVITTLPGRWTERSRRAAPPGPKARRCRDGRAWHRSGMASTQREDDGVTDNEAVTADMAGVDAEEVRAFTRSDPGDRRQPGAGEVAGHRGQ